MFCSRAASMPSAPSASVQDHTKNMVNTTSSAVVMSSVFATAFLVDSRSSGYFFCTSRANWDIAGMWLKENTNTGRISSIAFQNDTSDS